MQSSQLIIPLVVALAFLLASVLVCHHTRCRLQDHLELLEKLDQDAVKRMLAQSIATGCVKHGELVKLCSDFEQDVHDVYEESRRTPVMREARARGSPPNTGDLKIQCIHCGFEPGNLQEASDHKCTAPGGRVT